MSCHFMIYAGLNFKTCPIELREAWHLVENSTIVNAEIIKVTKNKLEFVNISTCNRFDICIFADLTKEQVVQIFYQLANCVYNTKQIEDYIYFFVDLAAMRQLIKVTASLDSLIIGEQQIFGQVKAAFIKCKKLGFASNKAQRIFDESFRVTKKIRHQTDIGKNSVSIAYAAIKIIQQIYPQFIEKKILIIGAGDMAKLIAKNLAVHNIKNVDLANRSIKNAQILAKQLNKIISINIIELSAAINDLYRYDICLIAVKGNNYIIDEAILTQYNDKSKTSPTVFIDVSVPRAITPSAKKIDNLFVSYIDDLDKLMAQNREQRQNSALEAQEIIEKEIKHYAELHLNNPDLSYIANLHNWLNNTIDYEVQRYLYNISNGKPCSDKVISNSVTKRIISHMAKLSRNNTKLNIDNPSIAQMLEFLFQLSAQSEREFNKKLPT